MIKGMEGGGEGRVGNEADKKGEEIEEELYKGGGEKEGQKDGQDNVFAFAILGEVSWFDFFIGKNLCDGIFQMSALRHNIPPSENYQEEKVLSQQDFHPHYFSSKALIVADMSMDSGLGCLAKPGELKRSRAVRAFPFIAKKDSLSFFSITSHNPVCPPLKPLGNQQMMKFLELITLCLQITGPGLEAREI